MKRNLAFSGTWYPSETGKLDGLISSGQHIMPARNAVLPHAGLFYSAPLISSFFMSLSASISKVIIISPSHYYRLKEGTVYSYSYDEVVTPYGNIPCFDFPADYVPFREALDREHGIEMFLPFAGKRRLSVSFALISRVSDPEEIASQLRNSISDDTAVIASSDFTHYGPRFRYMPYGFNAKKLVEGYDQDAASLMAEGNTEKLLAEFSDSTICGLAPASIVSSLSRMLDLEGKTGPHYTSADITGDEDDFVSYATVFWREKNDR